MALPDGIDRRKLLEIGLAMLHLTMHDDGYGTRAWKGINWDLPDALHDQGWISDPKSKAKSVALTEEGERLAAEFSKSISDDQPSRTAENIDRVASGLSSKLGRSALSHAEPQEQARKDMPKDDGGKSSLRQTRILRSDFQAPKSLLSPE